MVFQATLRTVKEVRKTCRVFALLLHEKLPTRNRGGRNLAVLLHTRVFYLRGKNPTSKQKQRNKKTNLKKKFFLHFSIELSKTKLTKSQLNCDHNMCSAL